jgi:hypothetical protein
VAERFVHEASIIPRRFSAGHVVWSKSPVRCSQPIKEKVEMDYSNAARLASLFAPFDICPRWKAIRKAVRTIRHRAEEIVEENWVEVLAIAGALEKHKRLDRSQIETLAVSRRIGPCMSRSAGMRLIQVPSQTSSSLSGRWSESFSALLPASPALMRWQRAIPSWRADVF